MNDTAELDAIVARNIGDIEAALLHARQLEDALFQQLEDAIADELGDAWHVEYDEDHDFPIVIQHQSWAEQEAGSRGKGYRLQLEEMEGANDETDETWFSTMMGAGPNGAQSVLFFWHENFNTNKRWGRICDGSEDAIDRLEKAGFVPNYRGRLYLPFKLDRDLLVRGYETGDMSEAMQAARDLAAIIRTCEDDLIALIKRDRELDG